MINVITSLNYMGHNQMFAFWFQPYGNPVHKKCSFSEYGLRGLLQVIDRCHIRRQNISLGHLQPIHYPEQTRVMLTNQAVSICTCKEVDLHSDIVFSPLQQLNNGVNCSGQREYYSIESMSFRGSSQKEQTENDRELG